MKTQITRRLALIIIALFFAAGSNNGSNMYPASNINHNAAFTKASHTVQNCTLNSDMDFMACSFNLMIEKQETPMIPAPNGDHEFHSFSTKHAEKHNFWKNIIDKIASVIFYLIAWIFSWRVSF